MMNTATVDQLRKLSAYQNKVPGHRANARLHLSTLIRWVVTGVKVPDGSRLRLRAVRAGSRWLTTDEWFAEYLDALTAAHAVVPTQPTRSPAVRNAATAQAGEELRRLGM